MISEFYTNENTTTLIIVAPESEQIFTSNESYMLEEISIVSDGVFLPLVLGSGGEFIVEDVIVSNDSGGSIDTGVVVTTLTLFLFPNPFN